MAKKDEIYAHLVNEVESVNYRYGRYQMVSYCIGYYEKVDKTIWECINKLYDDGFIDE